MQRPWSWPSEAVQQKGEELAARLGVPRPVGSVLARRGITEANDLEEYLNPRLDRLGDPGSLDAMDRAVARVWKAVDDEETVFIHGDYDVDGVTGTAFLARTLGALGARVVPFVPSRAQGYGLGAEGLAAAKAAGARLLITVDNGIRAVEEVEAARSLGMDVVILDHHEPGERLPDAAAVVHPRRGPGAAQLGNLSGVGVAAKLVHGLALARRGRLSPEVYKDALQLVALGTIADVVPLSGENRILVAHGLRRLSQSRWAGILALKAVARMDREQVTSADVAFHLAPRLNAAGRMGEARDALDLLLTDDTAEAYRLATRIEALNLARRETDRVLLEEVSGRVRAMPCIPPALVLWSDTWPLGVLGIAAGRVLERFHRPAFLIAVEGDRARGSARSRPTFPLPEVLGACRDLIEEGGGHPEAAGFSIRRENLEAFRVRVEALAERAVLEVVAAPLELDGAVALEEIDPVCVRWLDRLSPFGKGNPEPLFAGERLTLDTEPTVVGKSHLRLTLASGRTRMRAIAFGMGERVGELRRGATVDAVFHAGFDSYRGGDALQLIVRDLRTR